MICVAISGPTYSQAAEQLKQASMHAELAELRLDLFESIDQQEIARLQGSIPLIFTLRSAEQGGRFKGREDTRLETILKLAELAPAYIDLESHVPPEFVTTLKSRYPHIKLIISYHDFQKTPEDLEKVLHEMKKLSGDLYKLAFTAQNSLDTLRLLLFLKEQKVKNLISISMGEDGAISRILGPVFGSIITYASVSDSSATAPGQISAEKLIKQYRAKSVKDSTSIYALIGYPLADSISDIVHNALYDALKLDAIYVKLRVQPDELPEAMRYFRLLAVKGLSVTMPLKEALLTSLDHIDETAHKIGAANTVLFEHGKAYGSNSDCSGALDALEQVSPVEGKKAVLLGAGGVARAIAYELVTRGAQVSICNRDEKKAELVARMFGCTCSDTIDQYDILINATPLAMPIAKEKLLPTATIMETTILPVETELLKEAKMRGCTTIPGYKMWIEQALRQYAIWMGTKFPKKEAYKILEESLLWNM